MHLTHAMHFVHIVYMRKKRDIVLRDLDAKLVNTLHSLAAKDGLKLKQFLLPTLEILANSKPVEYK